MALSIGVFNVAIARAFNDMGNLDSCIYHNLRTLAVFVNMGNTYNMATTFNNISKLAALFDDQAASGSSRDWACI
ncbi:MAG: hypothetical protein BGO21_17865 [Dyadobacter sp. 50-39]|uniref:hypothetical protein n=1 Tax=Dyadobacter sp. 50-39 TaxID=1895756 RepID=UPI0009605B40|nr:hypothetical protein [Dyadobacter sp. 50-39]OJV14581.1 MAG: hypothetical protein BGO21_17865 [Dyadobacter sp. 50-39]